MELFIFPFVIVILGFAGVMMYFNWKKEKERRLAMNAWAARRGLRFSAEKEHGLDSLHPEYDCLKRGSNRYAYNIMEGEIEEFRVKFFDYHYETHSTDSKGRRQTHHHHFSAVLVGSPFRLKPLHIRPEGVFDKVKAAFGWDDINFESAEFSRRYHVTAPDKRWAYDVLHSRVIERLLHERGYAVECDMRSMLGYHGSQRFDLLEMESAFWLVAMILRNVPDHAKERAAAAYGRVNG